MIATHIGTFFIINKCYNPQDDECSDCTNDFKAMCSSATDFNNQETVTAKEGSNSQLDNSPKAKRLCNYHFKINKQNDSTSSEYN